MTAKRQFGAEGPFAKVCASSSAARPGSHAGAGHFFCSGVGMSRYQPIREAICHHVIEGRLSDGAAWTYVWLILRSYRGLIWTNASVISGERGVPKRTVQEHLRELKDGGYIKEFRQNGSRGAYPILVHKYETVDGTDKARLNALETQDFREPKWERSNPESNSERKGERKGDGKGRCNTVLTPTTPTTPTTQEKSGSLALPDDLDKEPFSSTWSEWISYRRKHRWTTKRPWAEQQLSKLAQYGPAIAAQALRQSMENGWKGVFPEKVEKRHKTADREGAMVSEADKEFKPW